MSVSAVVVSHGHAAEIEQSLPALVPQVDELVLIANLPGSVGIVPPGVRVIENPHPLPLAANVNLGIAATSGSYVLCANPDAIARARCCRSSLPFHGRNGHAAASPGP